MIEKLIWIIFILNSLEDKAHIRTKSTPLNGGVGGVGGRDVVFSPVKAGKVSTITSAHARDAARRPIRSTNAVSAKRWEEFRSLRLI